MKHSLWKSKVFIKLVHYFITICPVLVQSIHWTSTGQLLNKYWTSEGERKEKRRNCSVLILVDSFVCYSELGLHFFILFLHRLLVFDFIPASVETHEWTDDFTIFISIVTASYTKRRVDNWWQFGIKLLHYRKCFAKKVWGSWILCLYFAAPLMNFICFF